MCIEHYKLDYERTDDVSVLFDFYCGIEEMDEYIHNRLQTKIREDRQLKSYIIRCDVDIVAMTAIKETKFKIKTKEGSFYAEALEIEYLAVKKDFQRNGIGKQILDWIEERAILDYPNVKYLIVSAYTDRDSNYTAEPFYSKSRFKVAGVQHPMANCINMAKKIVR